MLDCYNYCVYEHINKINGKRYIGITRNTKRRWASNGKGYIGNKEFYSDIVKYGWDNFEHNVLIDNLNIKDAAKLEEDITKARRKNFELYNMKDGCDMSRIQCSPEAKERRLRAISKRVYHNGVTYNSIRECAAALNMTSSAIRYYLNSKYDNRGFFLRWMTLYRYIKLYESEVK